MKAENMILIAIGAFLLYRYMHSNAVAQPAYIPPQIPGTATPPYFANATVTHYGPPPKVVMSAAEVAAFNAQQNIINTANTGTANAGAGVAGIGYLCDTSNKLTMYGTNANYNAVTLKY